MASDSWRYPLTMLPDYMGPGTPVQQYEKARADLVTPSPASPAATSNAVAGAAAANEGADQPAYPTAFRSGYDSAQSGTTRSVPVPRGPVNRDSSPYPGAVDMTNARMTAPGFALPTFNAPPPAVAAGAAGVSNGVGLLPPEFHSQIGGLLDEARPLLSSAGIVDRLRGRQLLRARDRLIQGATSIAGARTQGIQAETGQVNAGANVLSAQTGAYRATNEVPLALLGAATHKYGYDVGARTAEMQDATHRYTNDQNVGALKYGTDARLLEAMPKMQRDQLVNDAITSGDMETAHGIAGVGLHDLRPVPPTVHFDPTGTSMVVAHPSGDVTTHNLKDLVADSAAKAKAANEAKLKEARAAQAK